MQSLRAAAIWLIALQVGAEYVHTVRKADSLDWNLGGASGSSSSDQSSRINWRSKKQYVKTTIPLPSDGRAFSLEYGESSAECCKTMIFDGGDTELTPGDLLRYVKVPGSDGKPKKIFNLKDMTHEEIKARETEFFVPGAEITVSMSDPDFDDTASTQLRELHEQRCGGKCAKSKDGKIVVETQEAQSEACQYRYFAWDWQRQTCRMSDNAMLNEDAQLYLTLHLDTAVYKAQKYTQNCKGGIVPTNFKRRCQRRMQQIGHALMFIPKAKDKVGQPLTTEQQRKIKYVQTAIGGEDAKYAEMLQRPTAAAKRHPMLAAQNIVQLLFALRNKDTRSEAIQRIESQGADPTTAQIDEEAQKVRGPEWTERRWDAETKALVSEESKKLTGETFKVLDKFSEDSDSNEPATNVSVQGERKLHSSSSFFEVSEAAKAEWWALFMTSWVLLIIIALVGFIAFNTYPAILLSVLVWVIIVFLTCGIGGRELNQMMTIDSTKKEEEQAELREKRRQGQVMLEFSSRTEDDIESKSLAVVENPVGVLQAWKENGDKFWGALQCIGKGLVWPLVFIGKGVYLIYAGVKNFVKPIARAAEVTSQGITKAITAVHTKAISFVPAHSTNIICDYDSKKAVYGKEGQVTDEGFDEFQYALALAIIYPIDDKRRYIFYSDVWEEDDMVQGLLPADLPPLPDGSDPSELAVFNHLKGRKPHGVAVDPLASHFPAKTKSALFKTRKKESAVESLRLITSTPPQSTFLCALEFEYCNCVGKVYYGNGRREVALPTFKEVKAHRHTEVWSYGMVKCDSESLCQDPAAPGYEFHRKVCFCDGFGIDRHQSEQVHSCCCNSQTNQCQDMAADPITGFEFGCGLWDHIKRKTSRLPCSELTFDSPLGLTMEDPGQVKYNLGLDILKQNVTLPNPLEAITGIFNKK